MKARLSSPRLLTALLLAVTASLFLTGVSGCRSHGGDADTEWRSFRGEMVWVPKNLDGFWGLRTREFGRIHPLSPVGDAFHRDGLNVRGELLLRHDMASIRSWGKMAELRDLELIED